MPASNELFSGESHQEPKQLTPAEIEKIGRFMGSRILGMSENDVFDHEKQQALQDEARLATRELLEPLDEQTVPEEIEWGVPGAEHGDGVI